MFPGCEQNSEGCAAPIGLFDASLKVRHSVVEPVVGGNVRFSRGVALLQPQAPPASDGAASDTASEARRLLPAFSALARGDGLTRSLSRLDLLQQARHLQAAVRLSFVTMLEDIVALIKCVGAPALSRLSWPMSRLCSCTPVCVMA